MLAVAAFSVVLALYGVRRAVHWGTDAQAAAWTLATPSGALLGAVHQHATVGGLLLVAILTVVSIVGEYRSGMLTVALLFAPNRATLLIHKLVAMLAVMLASVLCTALALWAGVGGVLRLRYGFLAHGVVPWRQSGLAFGRAILIYLLFLALAAGVAVLTRSAIPTLAVVVGAPAVTVPLVTVPEVYPYLPQRWTADLLGLQDPWQFLTYFWARAGGTAGPASLTVLAGVLLLAAVATVAFVRSENLATGE